MGISTEMIGYSQISLSMAAIENNVAAILERLNKKTKFMAVVKANAYGHGAFDVAQAAVGAGADWLGVARVAEGLLLRQKGITAPILVLGIALENECEEAVINELTLTLAHHNQLGWISEGCKKVNKNAEVHIKIDTGMNRLGVKNAMELLNLYEALLKHPQISLTGAFTHFSKASEDLPLTCSQLETFLAMCKQVLPQNILLHTANSAAALTLSESHLDMVRIGIALYGYPPVETNAVLLPVMEWKTRVTFVKIIPANEAIGYGGSFVTNRETTVATIALGYGDGYLRALSNKGQILLNGKRVNIIGRVCMDQLMVDVTDIPPVKSGDEAVLIGKQGDGEITAQDVARWAGTLPHEILLSPNQRVNRTYEY